MSNWTKVRFFLALMFLNHCMTSLVLCHWFAFVASLTFLLMFSRRVLLTFPNSDFAGLINLCFGSFEKPSLWSFKVINASPFARHLTLSTMFRLSAINFASLLMVL